VGPVDDDEPPEPWPEARVRQWARWRWLEGIEAEADRMDALRELAIELDLPINTWGEGEE